MSNQQPSQGQGDLRIPMDQHDLIKKERQDQPYCACGRCWLPLWVPAMQSYVRQCPACPQSASYCLCDTLTYNGQQGATF